MYESGGALGVQKLNSATVLIQRQPRRLPHAKYVLHRLGCSQEKDQLLREGWKWSDSRRRRDSCNTIRSGQMDPSGRPGHGADLGARNWGCQAFLVDKKGYQLLRAVRRGEQFGKQDQAHPSFQAAQQASAERADRGGQVGTATEVWAGAAV